MVWPKYETDQQNWGGIGNVGAYIPHSRAYSLAYLCACSYTAVRGRETDCTAVGRAYMETAA